MDEFLIGTGIALLLVLIGWSEQIKSWHKDTREAERDFSRERNIKWNKIRPLLRTNTSAIKKLKALNALLKEKSLQEVQDVNIIGKFISLDKKRAEIESLYKIKYRLIFALTISFFLSGIINYFIADNSRIKILIVQIPGDFFAIFFCMLFSVCLLCFNSHLTNNERKYKNELINLMESF